MNNNNKLQFFKHSLLALSVVGALGSTASAQQENANAKSEYKQRKSKILTLKVKLY